jgi:hypothetical protein
MRTVAVALVLGLASSGADAQTPDLSSGNFLYPHCRAMVTASEPPRGSDSAFWQGVCSATVDALRGVGPSFREGERFCIPERSTLRQGVSVALAYMDRNPDEMHLAFSTLVLRAFREAWPCEE